MKRLIASISCLALSAAGCAGSTGSLGSAPTASSQPSRQPSATAPPTTNPTLPSSTASRPAPSTTTKPTTTSTAFTFANWFVRNGKLFVTQRTAPSNGTPGLTSLSSLLDGPSPAEISAGVTSVIPAGTQLLGLAISGGLATVDLSAPYESAATSSTMALRLAQVVYTITQFATVTGVRFQIDGQSRTMVGGVPVQDPQTRTIDAGYLPAITVKIPTIGSRVPNPVVVSGTADVFEATVSIRILDANGTEIARTFTTASCGTGCRGDYSATINYSVPHDQPGTIEVYQVSPREGSHVDVQSIPVTLES
jgi:hypothetical protein